MTILSWCGVTVIIISGLFIQGSRAEPFWVNLTGKATWQSSDYGGNGNTLSSDLAVDGCYNTDVSVECCAHTADSNDPTPYWAVDLGQRHVIFSVNLTNRDVLSERLNDFVIYGSNISHDPAEDDGKEVCISRDTAIGASATEQLSCMEPIEARYVIIQKTGDVLTLCEVDVEADCPDNTYGGDCIPCSENCASVQCDSVSGACDGGCKPGYTSDTCVEECPNGTYGYSCDSCSTNCLESPCEKFSRNGNCSTGCKTGYTGDTCVAECPDGTYGDNCDECVNCLDSVCDKFSKNKNCINGCSAGYIGENCTRECENNTYGLNCQNDCHANCKESCDHMTGNCIGGCIDNWTGDHCDEEASTGATMRPCWIGIALAVFLAYSFTFFFVLGSIPTQVKATKMWGPQ